MSEKENVDQVKKNLEDGSIGNDELEVPTATRRSSKPARPSYSRIEENGEVLEMPVKEPEGSYKDPSESTDFRMVAQNNGGEVIHKKGTGKAGGEGFMKAAQSQALRPFVIISSSYLLFTITDGAIRMIVLQHAYNKSFSAMQVAVMFTLYELAGVFTNLVSKKRSKNRRIADNIISNSVLTIRFGTKLGCWIYGCKMGY